MIFNEDMVVDETYILTLPKDLRDLRMSNNIMFVLQGVRQISNLTRTWETKSERYKFVDDCIFRVYGMRKNGAERTLDFVKNKILPLTDYKKYLALERELDKYTLKQ